MARLPLYAALAVIVVAPLAASTPPWCADPNGSYVVPIADEYYFVLDCWYAVETFCSGGYSFNYFLYEETNDRTGLQRGGAAVYSGAEDWCQMDDDPDLALF